MSTPMDPREESSLAEALPRFMAAEWSALVTLAGSKTAACGHFVPTQMGFYAMILADLANRPSLSEDERQIALKDAGCAVLAGSLLKSLCEKVRNGEFILTGEHSLTGAVQEIRVENADSFDIDLCGNEIRIPGRSFKYLYVRVRRGLSSSRERDVEKLLRERRLIHGDERKKELEEFARQQFGPVRVKDFNAAFKTVYGYERGRAGKNRK